MSRGNAPHPSILLRCLLIVSLWQAPLPVWHSHGTLADGPAESRGWLARHLESHHAAADPCDSQLFGWHLHFDVPTSDSEPSEAPGPSARLPAPSVVVIERAQMEEAPVGAAFVFATMPGLTVNPSAAIGQLGRRCLGFFTHYAMSLALPLRLGVARC